MVDYTIDMGLNEKSTIVNGDDVYKETTYNMFQGELNKFVTHDLLYNYTPNFNGGYIILMDPGPWYELLKFDRKLKERYGEKLDEYMKNINKFMLNSLKLAYQFNPGAVSVNSDNYNLRHINQQLFSHEAKINNISITYLEEGNIVEHTHYLWIEFMKDLKKGMVDLPDKYLAKDTDIFYQVPYFGQVWAYAYNPVDLRPREIIKYVGVYPSNDALSDSFGQRGQNNHFMKDISYNVVDFNRSVYPVTEHMASGEHFAKFYKDSVLFKDFIDTCVTLGLLNERNNFE